MPKVILQISYDIEPSRLDEYLALARELRAHFSQEQRKNYSVFEQKGKKSSFVEQFVCNSMEEFEALEDDLDQKSEELVNKLETMIQGGKAKYTTLVELG
jgi:hypothetical protein